MTMVSPPSDPSASDPVAVIEPVDDSGASIADGDSAVGRVNNPPATARLLIIGGGMTAFGIVRRLLKDGPSDRWNVEIFAAESEPPYDRVALSERFNGRDEASFELAPRDWYQQRNVALHLRCRIESIDRDNRQIIDQNGHRHDYDTLVLATGSRAWVPPIDGADLDGVFVYRTMEDLRRIERHVRDRGATTGAVIGGGLLGLEAAAVLDQLGVKTSVIERAPGLMPRQLGTAGAARLRRHVESLGIDVHVVRRLRQIVQNASGDQADDAAALSLQFENAADLPTDIIIVAAGVRPHDELARSCGLPVGPRGGIVVDDTMRTDDPNIYAAGECVCHRGVVHGLVAPCYRMADVVADQLRDPSGPGDDRFEGADSSAKLKLLGIDVATAGESIGSMSTGTVIDFADDDGYRKLLLRHGRIVGAAGVGDWPQWPQIRDAIDRGQTLMPWHRRRFAIEGSPWAAGEALPVALWNSDAIICSCHRIRHDAITAAIDAGASDVQSIGVATGAGTACGSCRSLVCELAGAPPAPRRMTRGGRAMLAASVVAAAMIVIWMVSAPVAMATSVQDSWRQIDVLWRSDLARQITGWTTLALMAIGLLFSLRKRAGWFRWGSYGFWRAAHGVLGSAMLIGVAVHSGLRVGENLNLALSMCLMALSVAGSAAGVLSALEPRLRSSAAMRVRWLRPRLTTLHTLLFWPLPTLIAAHVVSFYWFSS